MTKAQTIKFLKQQVKKSNDKIDKLVLTDKSFQEENKIRKQWLTKLDKVNA